VVSNLWSLLGDVASSSLFARLSPTAKIPFQTRTGQADRKSARGFATEIGSFLRRKGKIIDSFANSELAANMDKLHTYLGV
jgi:hypothetical protein